jgi:hypothetical protein
MSTSASKLEQLRALREQQDSGDVVDKHAKVERMRARMRVGAGRVGVTPPAMSTGHSANKTQMSTGHDASETLLSTGRVSRGCVMSHRVHGTTCPTCVARRKAETARKNRWRKKTSEAST